MSPVLGPLRYATDDGYQKSYSDFTNQQIDEEVSRILNERYVECTKVLTENKHYIELLAERLLEKEVLSLPDIVEIMGPRPFPMKESLREYLEELKEREIVDAKLVEDAFTVWFEAARVKSEEESADPEVFAAIEKEIEESKEKGETVQVFGKRMMEAAKDKAKKAKVDELKFVEGAAEKAEKEEKEKEEKNKEKDEDKKE